MKIFLLLWNALEERDVELLLNVYDSGTLAMLAEDNGCDFEHDSIENIEQYFRLAQHEANKMSVLQFAMEYAYEFGETFPSIFRFMSEEQITKWLVGFYTFFEKQESCSPPFWWDCPVCLP